MINKSNDLPYFVNETNLPSIVDKLSNASNIKITGNKYGNRVQTVVDKIVEKADDITKAIEQEVNNNSYSFKVGQGNNVDVTSDVQDSFSNLAIKGVTYQNLILTNSITKNANVTIENDIVTLLDTCNNFEGISYKTLTKANTTYTVVFNVKETFENGIGYKVQINDGAYLYNSAIKLGINKIKITTQDNVTNPHIAILKISTAVGSMKFSKNILLLEGDHTNNPNLPSYFEGIVGVGDKSKNLLNPTTVKNNVGVNISNGNEVANAIRKYSDFIDVIPSRYSFEVEGNCKFINIFVFDSNKNLICATHGNGTLVGDIKGTIDFSKEIFKGVKYIRILLANSTETNIVGNEVYNFYLNIGESVSSKYQYYDGHKIEILSNGKNLFNVKEFAEKESVYYSLNEKGNLVSLKLDDRSSSFKYPIKVKPNTNYTLSTQGVTSFRVYSTITDIAHPNGYFTHTQLLAKDNVSNVTFSSGKYDSIYIKFVDRENYSKEIPNIQLEESLVQTSYESHREDKTQILLDEPLMRLPNGVYDEITKDGKLIRRIKKVVVDSSKEWRKSHESYDSDTNITFDFIVDNITNGWTTGDNKICNIIFSKSGDKSAWNGQSEGISNDMYSKLFITLNKSKLQSQDIQGLKAWLDSNPVIIVYYELKTPIITDLSESQIRMFKDGHLTFNTLVAPESNHLVQLNKSGQIQNAIKESQSLDNRINVLENNYDNLMLSTISRLNNLELNYTLK